ncbi:hypothetical protein [Kitasatospora aureofaciens]|uniref:hypothetical protein n=1 Tax=Kitasatospora aureofaciens TaxID=1894 RepID=UPI0037F502D7
MSRPFNERVAVAATRGFGTMWACYALTAFSLLPLAFPDQQAQLLYWSNCVQLVALPLLMVGQQVLGRAAERRATETHDAVLAELALLREAHDQIAQLTTTTSKEGA